MITVPYLPNPPRRVVSLVPSLTESLFDLGFGASVVGVTDYCIHPSEKLTGLKRLGGTKNANVTDILNCQAELILANQEENSPETIHALQAAGQTIWLSFPQTVDETLADLRSLADLYQNDNAFLAVDMLECNLEFVRAVTADQPPQRVFCPIWQGEQDGQPWYMTCNAQTYTSDLLKVFGGQNVFTKRPRRYPLSADLKNEMGEPAAERDTRYPRVSLEEIRAAQPEIILLPSEPFYFDLNHQAELQNLLAETPAVQNKRIYRLEGSLLTWPGTRLGKALTQLPAYFQPTEG